MVKTVTQAWLDGLPPIEREIQNSLIRQGRITVATKEKGAKAPRTPEPLERLKETQVRLSIVGGTILEGTLREVSRFEIVLSTGERSLVILKHAILCCEEVKA